MVAVEIVKGSGVHEAVILRQERILAACRHGFCDHRVDVGSALARQCKQPFDLLFRVA